MATWSRVRSRPGKEDFRLAAATQGNGQHDIASAFLRQQQGGGSTQRLVHRFFTKNITPDIRLCPATPQPTSAVPYHCGMKAAG